MKTYKASHMIKAEDLNHHHNLYAGRAIEWMMEASFIAAVGEHGNKHGLLYKNTHQFDFMSPVDPGEIISYLSTVVRTGRTSFTIHVDVMSEDNQELKAEGYTTFVTIDENNQPEPHGILLDETQDEEELKWRAVAEGFFARKQ